MPENPVGTKEQREELRRHYREYGEVPWSHIETGKLVSALDGLDIAEEMAKAVLKKPTRRDGFHHCLICGAIGNSPMTISHTADCPVRRWQDWEQAR